MFLCKMYNGTKLKSFINQRLAEAAEEIFELFERTISEYEDKLHQQQKLLDNVLKPEVRLHRTDVLLPLRSTEKDAPEHQEWSPTLEQVNQAEQPQIKEEQEEPWSSQQGEQLQSQEEAHITKLPFIPVLGKTEDDDGDEKPQFSHFVRQTEPNRDVEHVKREADGRSDPITHENMSYSSEPKTNNSEETSETNSGLNHLRINIVSDIECFSGETSVGSSESIPIFSHKLHLQKQNRVQTGGKPFRCMVCGKRYPEKKSLVAHMNLHSKCFSCLVCKRSFQSRTDLVRHTRIHTGEKPFSCSCCGKRFSRESYLRQHIRVHTGEKPFKCSVCGRRFSRKDNVDRHMISHTGEKSCICSVCGKGFAHKKNLIRHMSAHSVEKPYS